MFEKIKFKMILNTECIYGNGIIQLSKFHCGFTLEYSIDHLKSFNNGTYLNIAKLGSLIETQEFVLLKCS